jgi:hypothetical protein
VDDRDQDQLRAEALIGAVDEDGDIVWFVSPRELMVRGDLPPMWGFTDTREHTQQPPRASEGGSVVKESPQGPPSD